jgi:DNA adenine methylase
MKLIGRKTKKLFNDFIEPNIKIDLALLTYVEPFGGYFNVRNFLKIEPKKVIYNDLVSYNIEIFADEIHYKDYKYILDEFDSLNTFFYLDPPYYGKEYLYNSLKYHDKFHIELYEKLKNIKGHFLMSYNKHKFIENLYKNFNIIHYDGDYKYFKNEILIKNY